MMSGVSMQVTNEASGTVHYRGTNAGGRQTAVNCICTERVSDQGVRPPLCLSYKCTDMSVD